MKEGKVSFFRRVGIRLAITFLLVSIVPFIFGAVYFAVMLRDIESSAIRLQKQSSLAMANSIERELIKIEQDLTTLAYSSGFQQLDPLEMELSLVHFTTDFQTVPLVSVLDRSGQILISREPWGDLFGETERSTALVRTLKKNAPVIGPVHLSSVSNLPSVTISVPVYDPSANLQVEAIRGVILAEVSLIEVIKSAANWKASEELQGELDFQPKKHFWNQEEADAAQKSTNENEQERQREAVSRLLPWLVTDRHGRILVARYVNQIGTLFESELLLKVFESKGGAPKAQIENKGTPETVGADGMFFHILHALDLDASIVAITPLKMDDLTLEVVILQPLLLVSWYAILIRISGLLLGGFILWAAVRLAIRTRKNVVIPLLQLQQATEKVAEGDFSVKVEPRLPDEIGALATSFNKMVEGLREREFIKQTFGRYVSKHVAEHLLGDKSMQRLGGKRREVSVLFSDIRSFTPYAETHTPEEVIETLNEYFSRMIDVIFKYEGTLDKFIGDCVMAVFNAPHDQPNHAELAVRAALDMQKALHVYNIDRKAKGKEPILIGIGVNTGPAVSGNIGSEIRTEFSVVGDTVNIASRLEGSSLEGQILIGENTYRLVSNLVEVKPLPPVQIKGKNEPVVIYEVIGLRKEAGTSA